MNCQQFKFSYVKELDGMRGIAILLVLMSHTGIPYCAGGIIGVDIFFVLSGFLITCLLVKEYSEKNTVNLKYFYLRRALRLGPALLLLITTLSVTCFIFLERKKAVSNLIDSFITIFYMTNWARVFDIHPPSLLGHTWSLSIEEQFYLLWPITLLALLRVVKNKFLLAALICFAALFAVGLRIYLMNQGASFDRLYNGLDTRADSLLTGCALGVLLSFNLINDKVERILSRSANFMAPVCVLLLLLVTMTMSWRDYKLYSLGLLTVELSTAIIILDIFLNRKNLIGRILSMKWLVWIGTLSYGIYLWHYPLHLMLVYLGFSTFNVMALTVFITFVMATCSYYLLERPFLNLKKTFENKAIDTSGL